MAILIFWQTYSNTNNFAKEAFFEKKSADFLENGPFYLLYTNKSSIKISD
jgi:hypothetical protein